MGRRRVVFLGCLVAASLAVAAPARDTRLMAVDRRGELPADFLDPEGRTEWDLSGLVAAPGSPAAAEEAGDRFLEWEVVGAGKVHLPSGTSRDITLQRGLWIASGRPARLIHRWLDPELGVVARISGPVTADGATRLRVDAAQVLGVSVEDAANLKIYVPELLAQPFGIINWGWDRGASTSVSSLVADGTGISTMGDLIARDFWDFSVNTSGVEVAQTSVLVNSGETCNTGQCGYVTGAELDRLDKSDGIKNNQVSEFEDRSPTDQTIWLRAGAQKEGVTACFGNGESRFCYTGTDPSMKVRKQVPLWRFPHQDAGGWYLQAADSWSSEVFDCEQNLFNTICGADPPGICLTPALLRTKACGDNSGRQYGEVLKGGVLKLPSGHTVNSLLVRSVADFCVYGGNDTSCAGLFGQPLQQVRTVVYLWQVPKLATVVLLQSDPLSEAPTDLVSFNTVAETDIGFGLFPPESIAVRGETAGTVDLWWDPGDDTHRIDDYRVYWDTDSGANSSYAFDSDSNPGQVTFNGTSATISGLAPATTYYFAVTSRSRFPKTCVGGGNAGQRCFGGDCGTGTCTGTGSATAYESLLFPEQVFGDGGFVYPTEVQATTTGGACAPTEAVSNLLLGKVPGGIQFCWDPVSDGCVTAYDLLALGSSNPRSSFDAVAQTGLATCWTGDPDVPSPLAFFLVAGRGTGGVGPR